MQDLQKKGGMSQEEMESAAYKQLEESRQYEESVSEIEFIEQ